MQSGDYRMSDSLHHLARLRTWGEVVTDSKNSLSEQIGEVIPVGRPAKVGPIRGEYVPQAAPTAGDKLPIKFPVCAACAVPVECTAHRICLLSLDSLANEFTHSEELT
jgi:hypothetical protein